MPFVSAVIVAAGSSSRMNVGKNKILLNIDNKAVIFYTLKAFENCKLINEIILVCRPEDEEKIREIAEPEKFKKIKAIVNGGETRSISVKNGIETTDKNCDYIAIHDGARPLVTENEITNTVSKAFETNAAAVGVPVIDTIKVIDTKTMKITDTPERSKLISIRTPQVFSKQLYLKALDFAGEGNKDFTDDCKLIEYFGEKVTVVIGEYTNIKITTKSDLTVAESILKERSDEK